MSSISWMAEKTSSELIPMLKNAYSALKDKEKDLVLAAELGKSLLEHNLRLKSSYDSLLQQTHTPPITPSNSITIPEEEEEQEFRFVPSRTTREAMIEVLEKKNVELSKKLELAVIEQENLMKDNSKNTIKLEKEINYLKSNLEIATNKIQELEEMNKRQRKQEIVKKDEEEAKLIEELYNEIDKMEKEKEMLVQSKLELEQKLSLTLKDLNELKKQFEQFEFTQQDFNELQLAYERQFNHIEELKSSLEEHRSIIQKLKENGVDTSSVIFNHTLKSEIQQKEDVRQQAPHLVEMAFDAISNAPSLMSLESVLSKATGMDQQLIDDAIQFINQIEAEHYQEKSLELYKQGDYNDLDTDENFGIFHDQHLYPESDLYPSLRHESNHQQLQLVIHEPTTLVGKLKQHVRNLFHLVWKWCRFSMILTAALIINASKGPDSLLIAY
ncbi:hypothetical protein BCV71DRAFT_241043 [Rhizopus microsporus]|nr:hypothetical protein BCV71DRAFT_241043 [Rhizopus microsporus]